ncbi:polyprenyl synthetase family protein [Candidatus Omnitrophota bacterium]
MLPSSSRNIACRLTGQASYARVINMLKTLKKDIDKSLLVLIKKMEKSSDLKANSPLLYAGIKDFLKRPGKRIRPILFLVGYLGYTKRKNFSYKKLLESSLSIELLHDFMLMHDDVIDKSDLRRGKPTLHKVFNKKAGVSSGNELGESLSIVAGDVVFAMAVQALFTFDEKSDRKERALAKFTETAATTGIGEFIDVVNGSKTIEKVTECDVLSTYTLKTAKYTFEAPLVMGAILAGADKKELAKLSKLGIMLGQAFQIQDDLLDIFSTSEETGKPVLSDLAEGKKTLLLWQAYKTLPSRDKKTIRELLSKKKRTRGDLLKLRDLIKESGSDEYCVKKIRSIHTKAERIMRDLNMDKKYKCVLSEFLNKI